MANVFDQFDAASQPQKNVFDQFDVTAVPHDHPAQTFRDYLSTSASQLGTGAREAWEGVKETGGNILEGYKQGTMGAQTWAAKPLYGAAGAAKAALESPVAEAAGNLALSHPGGLWPGLMGGEQPGTLPARKIAPEIAPEIAPPLEHLAAAPSLEPDIANIVRKNYGPEAASMPARSLGAEAAPLERPAAIAPTTADRTKALLRQQYGLGDMAANKVSADFEKHYPAVNKSTAGEIWNLVDAAQGQAPAESVKPQLRPLYDAFRTVAKDSEQEFRKVYATAAMDFQKMYFPQAYKNDEKLQQFLGYNPENMPGGVGQAWMTKKKQAFPTWRDARAAGLSPKYDNPIDMFKVYKNAQEDYLAAHRVKEAMQEAGTLKYPKQGIGGRPELPEGWAPLTNGPFTRNAGGVQAYAPREIASVWNTKFSRPISFQNPRAQSIWDATETAFNRNRSLKFLFSGYHALNMTKESASSSFGSALDNLLAGKPVKTMRDLTDLIPYRTFEEGKKGRAIYNGLIKGDERSERIIQAIAQANPSVGRAFGTPELAGTVHESIPQFLERHGGWRTLGAYKDMGRSVSGVMRGVRDSFIENGPFDMTPYKDATKAFGEAFDKSADLTSGWLFKHYIPDLKMGLMMRDVGDYLEANPTATNEQAVFFAQKLSDHVDDVMGEMMKDNLFWPKYMHQILDKAFLAPTYLYGTGRAYVKGLSGLAQQPGRLLGLGDRVPSFNKASPRYEPAMGYTLGLVATTAIASALYQKVKTGIWPDSPDEFRHPKTGGTTEVGKGHRVPERLADYGNIKEIADLQKAGGFLGGKAEPWGYADPKLNPLINVAKGLATMKDWRGDPIVTGDKGTSAAGDIGRYIWQQEMPISVSQGLFEPAQGGTGLSILERLMGVRPAGMQWSDPKGFQHMMDDKAKKAEKAGRTHRQQTEHHRKPPRNEDSLQ